MYGESEMAILEETWWAGPPKNDTEFVSGTTHSRENDYFIKINLNELFLLKKSTLKMVSLLKFSFIILFGIIIIVLVAFLI